MKRKLFILTALACVLGCAPEHEPDAAFLEQDCLALEVKGAREVLYQPETWQLGFSRENKQFRVHNDTMSEYYVVTWLSHTGFRRAEDYLLRQICLLQDDGIQEQSGFRGEENQ